MNTAGENPIDRSCSEADLWAKDEGDLFRVGITEFAQNQLGELVYVALPISALESSSVR